MYGGVLLVGSAGYTQVLTQHVNVLRQASEHDTGTGTLLVQVLHDVSHTAHAQHLLNVVGVHAAVLDVLEDGEHGVHTAACLVKHLTQSVRSHADSLGHLKRITLDGWNHSG